MKSNTQSVRAFYDKDSSRYIADRYDGPGCEQFSYRSRKAIALRMLEGTTGRTLDVGCGPAIYTRDLVALGHRPVSVDLSLEMLKNARTLAGPGQGLAWTGGQVERLPFKDASFDNVLAVGVLAYAPDTLAALRELARVLKDGGTLVTQCSNPLAPGYWAVAAKDKVLEGLRIRPQSYDFTLTRHPRPRLLALLGQAGFTPAASYGYDYRIPFLEKFLPSLALTLMRLAHEAMSGSRALSWLGEGYMVKAVKNREQDS